MIKKAAISICVFMIFLTGIYHQVSAKTLNVKDCMEEQVDCSELTDAVPSENSPPPEDSTTKVAGKSNGSLIFQLIKMVFFLLLILGLIYILLKFLNKRNKLFQKVKALDNLGGISVGPSKSIQIIRIGSKIYLIGVGENVELLEEITDEKIKEELLDSGDVKEFQPSRLLPSLFHPKSDTDEANTGKKDFNKLFSTELDKLKEGRKKIIDQYTEKEDTRE